MKLIDAYNLLVEDGIADNQRYFAELYKHFQFKDTDPLKEYLEFIAQEPVQWIHGFPTKLTTKTSFSKPKTAVIKLLKKEAVHQDVGRAYAEKVHDTIWKTYKREWEGVLKMRERIRPVRSVNEQFDAESIDEQPLPQLRSMAHSVKSEEPALATEEYENDEHPQLYEELETNVESNKLTESFKSDKERVDILKQVLLKLVASLEPSVYDAFQLLVSCV